MQCIIWYVASDRLHLAAFKIRLLFLTNSLKSVPRTERSDTKIEREGGGEAGTVQSQSRHKKGDMTNIYVTDSDEEAIVNFVKDHEELYDKTSEQFKDKAGKECLWERFTSTHRLSVKVCKT